MTELRKRMIQDMVLAGLAPGTQTSYASAVAQLARHYMVAPDRLTEKQVRQYLLDLIQVQHVARGTFHCKTAGIRFFYVQMLDFDWALFSKKNFGPRDKNVCRGPSPMAIF